MHSIKFSTFALLMSKEGLKWKGTVGGPIFPFPSMPSFWMLSGKLIQRSNMNKKGYDQVTWLLVFLRMPLPFFYILIKFWSNGKSGISGLSEPSLFSQRCDRLTLYLLWVSLNSQNSGLVGIANAVCEWCNKEWWTCMLYVSPLLVCLLLSLSTYLQNTSSKIKLLRMLRWWKKSIKPSAGSS